MDEGDADQVDDQKAKSSRKQFKSAEMVESSDEDIGTTEAVEHTSPAPDALPLDTELARMDVTDDPSQADVSAETTMADS